MSASRPGLIRRFFGFVYGLIDGTRRFVVNLIFLLLVALVLLAVFSGGSRPKLLEDTALVIDLKGDIVEEFTGSAREAELAQALGGEERETQLRDLVAAIDGAAADPKITRIVLLLDDMGHAGMAKLHEVGAAIDRFRASNKQVVAWASSYEQRQYYIAARANEVYLHPMGRVLLSGFGGYRSYYHDALEKLGVTINVFRAGKYKSYAEPFMLNAPSKESTEEDIFWLNDAWSVFTGDIEAARHLPAGAVAGLIDAEPARLVAAGGDMARFALDEKLVDGLKTRDELRALMIKRGKPDTEHKTFRQVSLDDYRAGLAESGDHSREVGIIVAAGTITDGNEPQGSIGGRSTSELIRKAREDDAVKAVVLRVDSGGGSAFGSELIRREIELTHQAGKPVIVSMSDVAASGGYWVTTSADRVFADPATITGSIGVFGLFPTVDRTLDKLGVHTGGATTSWAAGAMDLRRPIDPRVAAIIQSEVGYIYDQFLGRVSQARKMTREQVGEVAQGRVWTGRQARERGLVDDLGGLAAAVQAAAKLAKLDAGYRTTYVEAEPKGWYRLLASLPAAALRSAAIQLAWPMPAAGGLREAVGQAHEDLSWLVSAPHAASGAGDVFVHCLCRAP